MDEFKDAEDYSSLNGDGSSDNLLTPLPEPLILQTDSKDGGLTSNGCSPGSNHGYGSGGGSDKKFGKTDSKTHIDTAAPFESVKQAVSKFGGITDWKAHRVQAKERRKFIEQELERANQEIPMFKKKSEAAEDAKQQVLRDLDGTKRLIEELKLNLERAQTEERQAKQDSELARLRVEEMEQGIADESSVAAKAQLEVARARHAAAVSELENVKSELDELRGDYRLLVSERDAAVKKAEEAMSASKEVERAVEDLTIQLITTKESIESTHAAHLEAEEHRTSEAAARDKDASNWEDEVKRAEEELEKVESHIVSTKELKSKLQTSSGLLQNLKDELAVYMQAKERNGPGPDGPDDGTRKGIQAAISVAKDDLDAVNRDIEKATEEITGLKKAANALNSELADQQETLTDILEREGSASRAVASLEEEIGRTRAEIERVQTKEQEAREWLTELPKQLHRAAEEAGHAKSLADEARKELKQAREAVGQAKAGHAKAKGRLQAVQKEIEAARSSEKLALGAISAASTAALLDDDPTTGVTLSLEEYYALSKKAHDAEEQASMRVAEAVSQVDIAKECEAKSSRRLDQVNAELASRKETLNNVMQKAEMAQKAKISVEQELRKWRAEGEQNKPKEGGGGVAEPPPQRHGFHQMVSPALNKRFGMKALFSLNNSNHGNSSSNNNNNAHGRGHGYWHGYGRSNNKNSNKSNSKNNDNDNGNDNANDMSPDSKSKKKKKTLQFPRFFMFMGRKKPLGDKGP